MVSTLAPLANIFAQYAPTRTEADVQQSLAAFLTLAPLGLDDSEVARVEEQTGDGTRRRIDVTFGKLIIEVKKDLRTGKTLSKAEPQLEGYLRSLREIRGEDYAGIITDGLIWRLYTLAEETFLFVQEFSFEAGKSEPDSLIGWLDTILLTGPKLKPTPARIEERLGALSPRFRLDKARLHALYEAFEHTPEIRIKRELWARLLRTALGANFADDRELFLDHTMLVVEAEIIAHLAVGLDPTLLSADGLLSGRAFSDVGINGVVEADFFDWPTQIPGGEKVINDLVLELSQFDWTDVQHDVLKHLYEAVISTDTRKHLGEYYTPDWLARRMVEDVVKDPISERVLDPACGSGTFLFHAIRKFLNAADDAELDNRAALDLLQRRVYGMDIHPVSVVLARVTYLLAITPQRLQDRGAMNIPVFLGDSVQWGRNSSEFFGKTIKIAVDAEDLASVNTETGTLGELEGIDEYLEFPLPADDDASSVDELISSMTELAATYTDAAAEKPSLSAILKKNNVSDTALRATLERTFNTLCELNASGRDHIWGYYARNQIRPVWLVRNPVDTLIGNPPWVAQRFMTASMQKQFKVMSINRGIWVGGKFTTQQDLVGLFIARTIELFLGPKGSFGYVVPNSVLSRQQFEGLRGGHWFKADPNSVRVHFDPSWDLSAIRPNLFPVPSAAVFGHRSLEPHPLPNTVIALTGNYRSVVTESTTSIDQLSEADTYASPYSSRARQGATITPRVLTYVSETPAGPLGRPFGTTEVTSLRSPLEKLPWRTLPDQKGSIEEQFLHSVLQGADIAPFRALSSGLAVLPIHDGQLLSEREIPSFTLLSKRWSEISAIWDANKPKATTSKMSLRQRLDYQGGLRNQKLDQPLRVVYTTSGTRLAAALIHSPASVIDSSLYWLAVETEAEGHYLEAVLNSDALQDRVGRKQAKGLFGNRHFHLLPWRLPIPKYDPSATLLAELSELGAAASIFATKLELDSDVFTTIRRSVRAGLLSSGILEAINLRVERLIGEK